MMISRGYILPILLAIAIVSNFSCSKGKNIPDVSNINVDFNIDRFDQALYRLDTLNIAQNIQELEAKNPNFFNLYFRNVLPLKDPTTKDNTSFYKNIKTLVTNDYMRHLMDTCTLVFQDFEPIELEFEEAFKFYKYHFPESNTPNLYTFISEYSYQSFIFDDNGKDGLGIGLDMFLGETYPYADYIPNNPAFSSYLTRTFNKDHLVKKTLDALIEDKVGIPNGERLLDYMIHNGKKIYILNQLLPHTDEEILTEYTPEQLTWCQDNETEVWVYLLGEELIYSTERKKIRKLIDPSPTGPSDMPPEAPGRIANWIGYNIVKAYMRRHPQTSLPELIAIKDPQIIMNKSKYKPRKK